MFKGAEIDLHDMPRKVLIDIIKQLGRDSKPSEEDEEKIKEKIEKADKEREETSDMHAKRGTPPAIAVTEDDLPEKDKDDEEDKKKKKKESK